MLAATSWFAKTYDYVLLGVHEANLIYRARKEWSLSAIEQRLLIRTMFADPDHLIPGWFWVSDNPDSVEEVLWALALADGNEKVRKGSANLLAKAATTLNIERLTTLAKDPVTAGAAIKIIRRSSDKAFLPLLRELAQQSDGANRREAIVALVEVEYLTDPGSAFSTLMNLGDEVPELLRAKAQTLDLALSADLLAEALGCAAPTIRLFAADYLRKLGALGVERARTLLDDPDHRVRRVGVIALLDLGEDIGIVEIEKSFARSAEASTSDGSVTALPLLFKPELAPQGKRRAIGQMVEHFHLSERRACRLVGLSRDSYRHPPVMDAQTASLRGAIVAVAHARRRFGYRRIHDLLRPAFPNVNHKRVYRCTAMPISRCASARRSGGRQASDCHCTSPATSTRCGAWIL